jgi:hypothetical protein
VTDAADTFLRERVGGSNPPRVGQHWAASSPNLRHGYIKQCQKKMNSDRQDAEDLGRVKEYYLNMEKVIRESGNTT